MKINVKYGMVDNINEVNEIRTNGTMEIIKVTRTDRDGYPYTEDKRVYTYEGEHYMIGTDRDGWAVAWVVK